MPISCSRFRPSGLLIALVHSGRGGGLEHVSNLKGCGSGFGHAPKKRFRASPFPPCVRSGGRAFLLRGRGGGVGGQGNLSACVFEVQALEFAPCNIRGFLKITFLFWGAGLHHKAYTSLGSTLMAPIYGNLQTIWQSVG